MEAGSVILRSVAPLLVLIATSASAQQLEFRGDFVETYMAEKGFLDTIPAGTKLNCKGANCSSMKLVRIYVFEDSTGKRQWFWSTNYKHVQYDEAETILHNDGKTGHIVYYDDTRQLMYRSHVSFEQEQNRHKEIVNAPVLTHKELVEIGDRNLAIHDAEVKAREKGPSTSTTGVIQK